MLQSSPSYQTLSSSSSSSMAMIQSSSSSMQNNNENNNNLIDQLPSSLALLRSIIYMRRAKDVSLFFILILNSKGSFSQSESE